MNIEKSKINIQELIPPSELWSPEFRDFHAKMVSDASRQPAFEVPAREAPKSEWDDFDALNHASMAELLASALKLYPVDVQDTMIAGVRVGIVTPRDMVAPENRKRVLIN